jgi:hypothetical protein
MNLVTVVLGRWISVRCNLELRQGMKDYSKTYFLHVLTYCMAVQFHEVTMTLK